MDKLTRGDLMSLEHYAERRAAFRRDVIAHKRDRHLSLGEHLRLMFEDRLTIQYQIQEMLRVERIFDAAGIEDELEAYNPLIPDGCNLKATMLLEFPDVEQRRRELARLIGVEDRVWVQVAGHDRVYAIADEDLERENEQKTSSVHFLRFELAPAMARDLKQGRDLAIGVDHANLNAMLNPVGEASRKSLAADLD